MVLAPDSFKGSLAAADVVAAMAKGVRLALGDAVRIVSAPLADGGEGTLDALLRNWQGHLEFVETVDAIGRPKTARFGLSADRATAIIEAAEANGLPAVMDAPLQPLRADSYGVGIIARRALDLGVAQILLCVGGSASTDGGTGLLRGLGARFLDAAENEVDSGGGGLSSIRQIDLSGLHSRAREVSWRIAVDVDNPLNGDRGTAAVFGPQKGASRADIAVLDRGLAAFAQMLDKVTEGHVAEMNSPGFGAAGGLPLAAKALLKAELVPGSQLVADAVHLNSRLADADIVLTGEGAFDRQSLNGKVVGMVLKAAPKGVPIVVIAGRVALSAQEVRAAGITAAFSLAPGPATLESLVEAAAERVSEVTAHVVSAMTGLSSYGASGRAVATVTGPTLPVAGPPAAAGGQR
ncbi:glycerate kinase [Cryobacterium sp. Hh7]|uniref:glycerate kinase n=1 Tax=Cryobacterium sp. Hh7 TaxID=1259159 RepID=UPI00351A49AD